MDKQEADGFDNNNVKAFHYFKGAYFGKLEGDVNYNMIVETIEKYSNNIGKKQLSIAIIDYDLAVFFIALDINDLALIELMTQASNLAQRVRFAEPNSFNANRKFTKENKPKYIFGDEFKDIVVEKSVPNFNSHGLAIIIDLDEDVVIVETPSGHRATFILKD